MDKTPIRARFFKRLARVNDQLCFAAFARHELESVLAPAIAATPDASTTVAFPQNPHGHRIYRKVRDIPEFAETSPEIALQMAVIAGGEYGLAYMVELQSFSRAVRPSAVDTTEEDAAEDQLFARMLAWLGSAAAREPYPQIR